MVEYDISLEIRHSHDGDNNDYIEEKVDYMGNINNEIEEESESND